MSSNIDTVASAGDYLAVRYTLAATFVIYVYDYLCTFDEEVRLIWPSRLSLVTGIFYVNRYLPFSYIMIGAYMYILEANEAKCRTLLNVQGLLSAAGIIFAECVLALRVYVIWDKSRRISILLITLLLIGSVGGLIGTALFFERASVSNTMIFAKGCSVKYAVRTTETVSYGLILLYEAFIFSLMLFKLYGVRRTSTRLIRIAYGDSVIYCICILLITIANVIILKTGSEIICHLLLLPQAAAHNLLCNRLLLRLRSANLALTEDGFLSIHLPPETTQLSTTLPTFRSGEPDLDSEPGDHSSVSASPDSEKNPGEPKLGEPGPSRYSDQLLR